MTREDEGAFGFDGESWACYVRVAAAAAAAARSLDQAERRVEDLRERRISGAALDQALRDRHVAEATLARLDHDCERLEAAHLSTDLTASEVRQRLDAVQAQLDDVDADLRSTDQRRAAVLRYVRDEALAEFRACARLHDRARQRDAQRAARAEQLAEFCR